MGWLFTMPATLVVVVAMPNLVYCTREDSVDAPHIKASQVVAQRLIVDCDPAGMIATGLDLDDDLAILNALSLHRNGAIELLGISVTGGNAQIDYTFSNALELIRRRAGILDTEIGVHRGGKPFINNGQISGTGLTSDATNFLIETIMALPPGTVTLLCLGPLTNIAAAYLIEPRIADRVQRIVSMGGTLTPGLPYDLNLRTDPVAAAIVWNDMNCLKIILPVETCIQAVFGSSQLRRVQDKCNGIIIGRAVVCSFLLRLKAQRRIMPLFVNRRYASAQGGYAGVSSPSFTEGFVMWDLVALWAAIHPALFDEWTYIDATVLPSQATGFLGQKGPAILLGGTTPCERGTDFNNCRVLETREFPLNAIHHRRNRIMAPLILKNESDLHELVFEHLFLQEDVYTMAQKPILTFYQSLGLLPELSTMFLVMTIGSIFIYRNMTLSCFRLKHRLFGLFPSS